jgi:7-cyano-7-deazaguanine reductase
VSSEPSKALDTFDNPQPDRDYTIRIDTPEFTCLCPMTGQPDFATILIEYIADKKCLELKALKMYFWSYRNEGAFHEAVTNKMLSDFVEAIDPRFMRVSAEFNVRGGVYTQIIAEHRADGWVAAEPVNLP